VEITSGTPGFRLILILSATSAATDPSPEENP
jgi:hypothetical protein